MTEIPIDTSASLIAHALPPMYYGRIVTDCFLKGAGAAQLWPDALVLVSEDGRKMAGRYLKALTPESWLFVAPEFAGLETPARKVVLDCAAAGGKGSKKNLGLLLTAAALRHLALFPIEACEAAIRRSARGAVAEENLAVLAESAAIAPQ